MKPLQQYWKNTLAFSNSRQIFGISLTDFLVKFFYIFSLMLIIFWLLPSERPFEYSNLTVGTVATEEIIAPFTFPIQKTEEELSRERREAAAAVAQVFDRESSDLGNIQVLKLTSFFDETASFFKQHGNLFKPVDGRMVFDTTNVPVDSFIRRINVKYNAGIDLANLVILNEIFNQKQHSTLQKSLTSGLREVYQQGILNIPRKSLNGKELVVFEDGVGVAVALGEVLDIAEATEKLKLMLQSDFPEDSDAYAFGEHLITTFVMPNLLYNAAVTEERREQAIHDVPQTSGFVVQDVRIVGNHEYITEEVYRKLYSLSVALKETSALQVGWHRVKFNIGKLMFALIVLIVLVMYIYAYRRAIFRDNRLLGMLTLIVAMQFIAAAFIVNFTDWPHQAIPIVLAPMLLAMLLDFGVAFTFTVCMSLILGAILSNDYVFTFTAIIIGSLAIFSVRHIRKRNQMFRAIMYVMAAYLVVDLTFGLIHFETLSGIFADFPILMFNALLTSATVFILIGAFERFFDITTDTSLLELADLNHPLLKRLSVEAPGTFHHSVVVANLAEAGAQATNANALLTRVGCYFHDVGKMLKPEYFVENQQPGMNKHDNLSPHMSCLILINHVKAGVELAEKYRLPKVIKQFIQEHHGTSVISYFYHKALENSESKDVNENDFRYPGPRPRSKETAIAMLADTVEAASRALNNPTPQRIRNLAESLVEAKLREGQLDDSDLTLKEITRIQEAFIPILTGIHHLRIEYPVENGEKERRNNSREKNKKDDNGGAEREKKPAADKPVSGAPANGEKSDNGQTATSKTPDARQQKESKAVKTGNQM